MCRARQGFQAQTWGATRWTRGTPVPPSRWAISSVKLGESMVTTTAGSAARAAATVCLIRR